MKIPVFDSRYAYQHLRAEIQAAIQRVCDSGQLVLGEELESFEREFADYVGARHAVGVKSGTDALIVALRALEIGAGDEVLTVANTAVPTVSAIRAVGAIPRFIDVDPVHLLMDPDAVEATLSPQIRCLVPVHLYGHPVDLLRIYAAARRLGIPVVADCAQAHGAAVNERHVGTQADIGCFSFYPTKNLGAMGDGGLCTTNNPLLAERMRQIRFYGFDENRLAQREGICSRLDELQAAILRVKLRHLDESLAVRRELAAAYDAGLKSSAFRLPAIAPGARHAYHLYVVRTKDRGQAIARLAQRKIGYGLHYPVPIHLMPAYLPLGYRKGDLPVTEQASLEVLSLPLHQGLTRDQVQEVCRTLCDSPEDPASDSELVIGMTSDAEVPVLSAMEKL
jgi:dTDP-4-amino-4,6-dideoxygalactose transaminase